MHILRFFTITMMYPFPSGKDFTRGIFGTKNHTFVCKNKMKIK